MMQLDIFAVPEARTEVRRETKPKGEHGPRGPHPRARRTDPDVSHRAAERAARGDKVLRQRRYASQLVAMFPGRTASELARIADDTFGADETEKRYSLCRRLPEIECIKAEAPLFGRERRWYPR